MRTECSRNCWMAGGIAGLLVWLSIGMIGSAGWMAGLFLGLLTAWFLGGILVWGVCQGAGNRADNEALLAGGWPDAPFMPSRRVVRAGGELVSEEPLALADRIPGGAPLDSRTVTAAQGGGGSSGGSAGRGGVSDSGARDEAAFRRPRIVAGAGPDAPVRRDGASEEDSPATDTGASRPDPAPDARAAPADEAGARTNDPALIQPAPGVEAQLAHPTVTPVEGMEPEKPTVRASGSEAVAMDSTGFVEPRADSEAGSDPRAPEGGIEPLAADGAASPEEQATGATGGSAQTQTAGKGAASGGEAPAGEDGDAVTGADDLTRIRGIGPMLQTWLAGYGVTRVEQIAGWDDADIARYAGMMGRQGRRIREEDWVGQARLLAKGGETAHSHAADTGEAD